MRRSSLTIRLISLSKCLLFILQYPFCWNSCPLITYLLYHILIVLSRVFSKKFVNNKSQTNEPHKQNCAQCDNHSGRSRVIIVKHKHFPSPLDDSIPPIAGKCKMAKCTKFSPQKSLRLCIVPNSARNARGGAAVNRQNAQSFGQNLVKID